MPSPILRCRALLAARHAKRGNSRRSRINSKAYFALGTVTLCWGANALFAKLAVTELSPMLLVSLRWGIVVFLLLFIAQNQVRKDWPLLQQHLRLLATLGALGFTAFNALYYFAARTTTALNLGIVLGIMPALVILGARLVYAEPIRPIQLVGMSLTLLGVVVVVSSGDLEVLQQFAFREGDVLVVLACVLYAGYTLWLRRRPDVDPISQFAVMAVAAFATSLPLSLIEFLRGDLQLPTTQGWVLVTLVALFPSLLAQVLYIRGVQLIGAVRATTFVNLVPIVASLLAVTFLGETFAIYHGVALLLVLGGIWLSERSPL